MRELIVGLVLATASGLTFVAYRHPKEYTILANILLVVGFLAFMGIEIWNASNEGAYFAVHHMSYDEGTTFVSDKAREDFLEKAKRASEEYQLFPNTVVPVSIGFFAFMIILGGLPLLGIVDKKADPRPKSPKKKEPEDVSPN